MRGGRGRKEGGRGEGEGIADKGSGEGEQREGGCCGGGMEGGWGAKNGGDREWKHSGACSLDMDCHVHISSHCYENSARQEKKRIQESCWKG